MDERNSDYFLDQHTKKVLRAMLSNLPAASVASRFDDIRNFIAYDTDGLYVITALGETELLPELVDVLAQHEEFAEVLDALALEVVQREMVMELILRSATRQGEKAMTTFGLLTSLAGRNTAEFLKHVNVESLAQDPRLKDFAEATLCLASGSGGYASALSSVELFASIMGRMAITPGAHEALMSNPDLYEIASSIDMMDPFMSRPDPAMRATGGIKTAPEYAHLLQAWTALGASIIPAQTVRQPLGR
jgi:hypothetical protein